MTIGLEIHLKLNSESKIFCRCKNEQNFETQANTNICPVCTWQPGALPLLSKEVVGKAIKLWKILNANIAEISKFDRKNYFYPDLPMGFQITQFYHPIIRNGEVKFWINNYEEERIVKISEAHLECDTAKMIHEGGKSFLDFNRAGTPLLEIVTAPDFTSAEEVVEYAKEVQRIARWNNLGDADLEKGQMRVDVNLSIREKADQPLNKKVEIKNINSFWAMKRAIEYEYNRQKEILENWWMRDQETRRWVDAEWYSFAMRSKEDAVDYRYFPEPDLPILKLNVEELKKEEKQDIPYQWIKICKSEFWFHKEFINALLQDKALFDFFFVEVNKGFEPKTVAKWIVGPMKWALEYIKGDEISLLKSLSDEAKKLGVAVEELLAKKTKFLKSCNNLTDFITKFTPLFDTFLTLEQEKKLLDNQLKIVFEELLQTGNEVKIIVKEKWFDAPAMDENALEGIVKEVLEANPAIVEQYKGGKESTIGFFVGQVMKKTWGKANPQVVQEELKKQLS